MTYTIALLLHVVECVGIYQLGWIPVEQVLGAHYLGYLFNIAIAINIQNRLTRST